MQWKQFNKIEHETSTLNFKLIDKTVSSPERAKLFKSWQSVNTKKHQESLFCSSVFSSGHQTVFAVYFKVRLHVIGCINHDIEVGLCSELLIRFFYYIHLGYGKKISSHIGIEPRSFRLWAYYSTTRPECLLFTLNSNLLTANLWTNLFQRLRMNKVERNSQQFSQKELETLCFELHFIDINKLYDISHFAL